MKLTLFAFLFFSFQLIAQSPEPVRQLSDGKYGFSLNNKQVIPAVYDYATHFRSGLALVRKNGKWGFIDVKGVIKTPVIYDKAELIIDGYARVWLGDEMGLIDTNGQIILAPGKNEVSFLHEGVLFEQHQDDAVYKGFIYSSSIPSIPAKYKEITFQQNYAYCKLPSGQLDVYYQGNLFLTGIDYVPDYDARLYPTWNVILKQENKFGVIDDHGNILQPFDFYLIEKASSPAYIFNEYEIDYILAMDKTEWFYSEESEGYLRFGEPQFLLATPDGKLISDKVFSEINLKSYPDGTSGLSGISDGMIAKFTLPGKVEFLDYTRIESGFDYSIAYKKSGESVIFDRNGNKLDSFNYARIPMRENYYHGEEGFEYPVMETVYEPYVEIATINGEDTLWSVYSVYDKKRLAEWTKSGYGVESANIGSTIAFVLSNESGKAYFLPFMQGLSPFEYEEISVSGFEFLALKKKGSKSSAFYVIEDDKLRKVADGKSILRSNTVMHSIQQEGTETSDPYSTEVNAFVGYFMFLVDENDKKSLVTENYQIVPLLADTLLETNIELPYILEYSKEGKWGMVNLATTEYSQADQDQPGIYKFINGFIYYMSADSLSYTDHKGEKLYSLAAEAYPFKKGSKTGMKLYPDFEQDEKVIIQPVYKKLQLTNSVNRILAQNTRKKWGVLDLTGDTILPFIYDEVYDTDLTIRDFFGNNFSLYKVRTGKKYGLISLESGHGLPIVYDDIYIQDHIYTVQNGRYRIYSMDNLIPKFEGEFDAVTAFIDYDNDHLYLRRNDLWYMTNVSTDGMRLSVTGHDRGYELMINGMGYRKVANGYIKSNGDEFNVLVSDPATECGCTGLKLVDGKIQLLDVKGKQMYPDLLTNIICDPEMPDEIVAIDQDKQYRYNLLKKKKTERLYRSYW